jgi:hypothetical protein
MAAKPAGHGALCGEAELHGDVGQRPAGVVDELDHEIGALRVENGREAGAGFGEVAVDGTPGAGEVFGDALDRAVAAGEQETHDLVDLLLPACRPRLDRLDLGIRRSMSCADNRIESASALKVTRQP